MRDFQSPNRSTVYAASAMAATSHPRATLAAVETLRGGGNAIDAAITAAAVLAVIEPQMTGIGGDCFVLYAPAGGGVIAYNGSGGAPAAAEVGWYLERGMPYIGGESAHSVTIPGAVEAWARLVADHGRRDFAALLAPAIALAEDGCPVPPRVAADWQRGAGKLALTETARAEYLPAGRPPRVGEIHRQPKLAATLRAIAEGGARAFYAGPVAEDMVATLRSHGGLHTADDFARHEGEYVEPISTVYRGNEVFECPPNGQGFVALLMLNICAGLDFAGIDALDPRRIHLQSEAGRLAYRDRDALLGDPKQAAIPMDRLLSPEYGAGLGAAIDPGRAMAALPEPALTPGSDTTYLTVVDGDGNAVSFINSLFAMFGSGLVSERTGVLLHNRGSLFTIEDGHPNAIAPGKRPMHTIMPGMLVKDGRAVMPFGVMGGHYQPFGHVHLLSNMLDFGLDVQQAIELPRFFHFDGVMALESGVPDAAAGRLAALGHDVRRAALPLGGGQAIWIDHETGVLAGGSDPRKDGCAMGY